MNITRRSLFGIIAAALMPWRKLVPPLSPPLPSITTHTFFIDTPLLAYIRSKSIVPFGGTFIQTPMSYAPGVSVFWTKEQIECECSVGTGYMSELFEPVE